jgi:hypothetical protein
MATESTEFRIAELSRLEALELREAAGKDNVRIIDQPADSHAHRELATATIALFVLTPPLLRLIAELLIKRRPKPIKRIVVETIRNGQIERHTIEVEREEGDDATDRVFEEIKGIAEAKGLFAKE